MSPSWFVSLLTTLLERKHLTSVQMCELMQAILTGACGEVETTALLIALRSKGESIDELAAAAAVLRDHALPFKLPQGLLAEELLDTCGTGGDGTSTFNISTATALVTAAAGVPVVKHGNRAVSSNSGSADVLSVLGVSVAVDAERAQKCLARTGMAFCLAPQFHPTLKQVSEIRRRLGVRTLFNCLGPLANPARAGYQLLGVGRVEWLDQLAGALARLGTRRAFLVNGCDGLDEISLSGPTLVREVRGTEITAHRWTPDDFGLEPCTLAQLQVTNVQASAQVIRGVLAGQPGPALRIVLANAGAALLVSERVSNLREGVELAQQVIHSGRASIVLEALVACSQSEEPQLPPEVPL